MITMRGRKVEKEEGAEYTEQPWVERDPPGP